MDAGISFPARRRACAISAKLGAFDANFSFGETMRFALPEWTDAASLLAALRRYERDPVVFGDAYVRFLT